MHLRKSLLPVLGVIVVVTCFFESVAGFVPPVHEKGVVASGGYWWVTFHEKSNEDKLLGQYNYWWAMEKTERALSGTGKSLPDVGKEKINYWWVQPEAGYFAPYWWKG